MPNCFQLTKIGEQEPTTLQDIDNDLWNLFGGGVPEPNDKWYLNWYGTVGFDLANGQNWDDILKNCKTDNQKAVVNYLKENYTSSAWYSPK